MSKLAAVAAKMVVGGELSSRMVANQIMVLHATTPHKYRYKAENEESGVGDVYLSKTLFNGAPPKELHLFMHR